MARVRAIVKSRQIADQAHASNGTPAHIFDQPIIGARIGRDHHSAASELAVVESQKQAAARVKIALLVDPHGKWTALQPRQTKENRKEVSAVAPSQKSPMPKRRHVGGKADAQKIDVVKLAILVPKPHNVALV
jgi:hypothetical protein